MREAVAERVDLLASVLGWGSLRRCLWKAEGWKRKVSAAESWSPSDGPVLKELQLLYGAYLMGDSCLPATCPWHCAFPLVTVKSRSHWTQRPESRTRSLFLSPLLLHAAYNVALTSLWELWGFSSQETVKHLQENRKVDLSYSCHLKKLQKGFTSAATEWQQEQLRSLPVSEADTVAVLSSRLT